MNLQVILLFLYCAIQVKTMELKYLKVPDCELSEIIDDKYAFYNCPNSIEPNFSIKYGQESLVIICNKEKRLENFAGENFNLFFKEIKIEKCNLSDNFSLIEFRDRLMSTDSPDTESLILYENKLTFVPTINIYSIKQIKMEFNTIKKIGRSSFSEELISVEHFELKNEPLEVIEPGIFDNLAVLSTVVITNVTVRRLPENLFKNNVFLNQVKLVDLNITELPRGFFSNQQYLSEVTLSKTILTNIPSDTFRGSTDLEKIDLSCNQLRALPNELFHGLKNLLELKIQSNQLQDIPHELFRDLENLERLDLQNNQITKITNNQFRGLRVLKKLYLNSNMIEMIESEAMAPFATHLKYANFRSNNISFSEYNLNPQKLPFKRCSALKELYLGYNKISMIFGLWVSSTHLRILDLEHNNINKLTDLDVTFQADQPRINLSNNKIRSIEFNNDRLTSKKWKKLNLVEINISYNPIICDCNLYNFKQYEENKRFRLPKESINFIKTNTICKGPTDMNGTKLADVKLEELLCDNVNTTMKTVCPHPCSCKFSPYKNADLVDCSNRNLVEAPYQFFPSRENLNSISLNLTGNKLTKLPNKNQSNYILVKELYASHNQIETIEETNFIDNLKVLVLDHNNLKSLTYNTINFMKTIMPSIDIMKLNHNFWPCDCDYEDLFYFLKAHAKLHEHDIVCYSNKNLFALMNFSDVCSSDSSIIMITSVSLSCIAIMSIVFTILYFKYYRRQLPKQDLKDNRLYDAFISYSQKDEHFVMTELVPKLESGPQPYKLCLQQRDWLEGDSIHSRVKESVEKSQVTVIILSKNYVTSVWGAIDYAASPKKALLKTESRVIVVIYGELPNDDELDDELKSYLKKDLHIEWGDKCFWDKIRYALPYRLKIVDLQTTEQSETTVGNSSNNTDPHIESFTVNERKNGCEQIPIRPMITPPESNRQPEPSQSEICRKNYYLSYDYHKLSRKLNIHTIQ